MFLMRKSGILSRGLSIVLCLAMVLALVGTFGIVAPIEVNAAAPTKLYVGDAEVTPGMSPYPAGVESYEVVNDVGVLTINSDITGKYEIGTDSSGIWAAGGSLKIVVKEDVNIPFGIVANITALEIEVYSGKTLTAGTADHSTSAIYVSDNAYGIAVPGADLTLSGTGNIRAYSAHSTTGRSSGIYVSGNGVSTNNLQGNLIAKGGNTTAANKSSYGIYIYSSFENSGNIIAHGGNAINISAGIYVADSFTNNSGNLTLSTGISEGDNFSFYTKSDYTHKSGDITNSSTDDKYFGLYISETAQFNAGNINVNAKGGIALGVYETLTFEQTEMNKPLKVTAVANGNKGIYGLMGVSITNVNGEGFISGTVNEVEEADISAISAVSGNIIINNSKVSANTSTNNDINADGIYTYSGKIEITDSDITANTTGSAIRESGAGTISIKGGSLEANATNGSVLAGSISTITDAYLDLRGQKVSNAGDITFDGYSTGALVSYEANDESVSESKTDVEMSLDDLNNLMGGFPAPFRADEFTYLKVATVPLNVNVSNAKISSSTDGVNYTEVSGSKAIIESGKTYKIEADIISGQTLKAWKEVDSSGGAVATPRLIGAGNQTVNPLIFDIDDIANNADGGSVYLDYEIDGFYQLTVNNGRLLEFDNVNYINTEIDSTNVPIDPSKTYAIMPKVENHPFVEWEFVSGNGTVQSVNKGAYTFLGSEIKSNTTVTPVFDTTKTVDRQTISNIDVAEITGKQLSDVGSITFNEQYSDSNYNSEDVANYFAQTLSKPVQTNVKMEVDLNRSSSGNEELLYRYPVNAKDGDIVNAVTVLKFNPDNPRNSTFVILNLIAKDGYVEFISSPFDGVLQLLLYDPLPSPPPSSGVSMTGGNGLVLAKGAEGTFTSSASFGSFTRVEVDSETLSEDMYIKKEGSIIITLKGEYTNTLAYGEHTISIVSTEGVATGTFTILDTSATPIPSAQGGSAKTGDSSNLLWLILAMSLAVGGVVIIKRKAMAK